MGVIAGPAKIPFGNMSDLPRPGNGLLTWVLYSGAQATGQEFIWSDAENDYIHVGERRFSVIGTWNADTNTPPYTDLVTDGGAWSVNVAGTTDVNGFNNWLVGDLLVFENGVYFRDVEGTGGGVSVAGLKDGSILMAKDGAIKASSISETDTLINVSKETEHIPGTIIMGGVEIKERGGFLQTDSNITGRRFIAVVHEITDSGSTRLVISKRGAVQSDVIENPFPSLTDATTQMTINNYTITATSNRDIISVKFNFVNAVDNLKAEVIANTTNKAIAYIPNKKTFLDDEIAGISVPSGVYEFIYQTPIAEVIGHTLTVNFNKSIEVFGNGTHIYRAAKLQPWEDIEVPTNQTLTALLETKTGDNRLDYSALKNAPNLLNPTFVEYNPTDVNVVYGGFATTGVIRKRDLSTNTDTFYQSGVSLPVLDETLWIDWNNRETLTYV